jgi:hypothetical protein
MQLLHSGQFFTLMICLTFLHFVGNMVGIIHLMLKNQAKSEDRLLWLVFLLFAPFAWVIYLYKEFLRR